MVVAIRFPTAYFFRYVPMKSPIDIRQIMISESPQDTNFSLVLLFPFHIVAALPFAVALSPGNSFPCCCFFPWCIKVATQDTKLVSRNGKRTINASEQIQFNRRIPFTTSRRVLHMAAWSDVSIVEIYLSPWTPQCRKQH